jgi:ribosomal protein S18 acetylase RimI-like enzyme
MTTLCSDHAQGAAAAGIGASTMMPTDFTDSGLTLRAATPDDVEAIATLWHRGWLDAHLGHVPESIRQHRRLVDFRKRVPPRVHQTTVATIASSIVGFVTVHDDEVEQIYVAENARGGGVANALLRHAEQVIAVRFEAGWLAVVPGNTRARRFYERNGWCDAGTIDYAAETTGGTMLVRCRRYEKHMTRGQES